MRTKEKVKFHKGASTPRQQYLEEVSEQELTRQHSNQLQQKYELIPARIDRKLDRPFWVSEVEWKRRIQDWFKMTKGLVPVTQIHKNHRSQPNRHSRFNSRPR